MFSLKERTQFVTLYFGVVFGLLFCQQIVPSDFLSTYLAHKVEKKVKNDLNSLLNEIV